MKILAFESTCDETAVAVVEDGRRILTDQIFSQADLHAVYGGVVPEIASRCHVESISLLAEKAIRAAGIERGDIDANGDEGKRRPHDRAGKERTDRAAGEQDAQGGSDAGIRDRGAAA